MNRPTIDAPTQSQAMYGFLTIGVVVLAFALTGCQQKKAETTGDRTAGQQSSYTDSSHESEDQSRKRTVSLFDNETLDGWEITNFGSEREIAVVDGEIRMEQGYPISGINRSREEELPKTNYEISLEAKRTVGIDFFCLLTFPVQKSHCSFVVAGWAGATVGLSCIDGKDASDNATTRYMEFENDRWYKIKVAVTDEAIRCWIDGEEVVNQKLKGHEISVRTDVGQSRPLGISAFESEVAYRNIQLTILETEESSNQPEDQ